MIILDKLSPHKSPKGSGDHERRWRVVLVPASLQPRPEPDRDHSSVQWTHGVHALTFAKLKALIRKAAARTQKALWHAVGQVRNLFPVGECYTFF